MSRIIIYNTKLSPELNAQVDNIQDYLNSLQATLDKDVQYQKVELDLSIKVDLPQEYQTRTIGNYVDLIQDNKHFYFFIMGAAWTAKNTVTLQLSLDTINTFNGDFHFTDKTHVIREHKSRFNNSNPFVVGNNTLQEVVDESDEGISGAVQYKVDEEVIYSGNNYLNQKWYIIYDTGKNAQDPNRVNVEVLPEKRVPIMGSTEQLSQIRFNDVPVNKHHFVLQVENLAASMSFYDGEKNVTYSVGQKYKGRDAWYTIRGFYWRRINASQWDIGFLLLAENLNEAFESKTYNLGDVSLITFINAEEYRVNKDNYPNWPGRDYIHGWFDNTDDDIIKYTNQVRFETYTPTEPAVWSREIADVDRTSQTIIKIIECPYCPIDLTWEEGINIRVPQHWMYDGTKGKITPSEGGKLPEFKASTVTGIDLGLRRNIDITADVINWDKFLLDPKLKHSAFYTYKLVYDNFSLPIIFERLNPYNTVYSPTMEIEYKQSGHISSALAFKAGFYNCTYTDSSDYAKYLISTRSLESPLYSDEYINYLRNGYNYDKKSKNTQTATSWITAGVSLVGSIATFAAGGMTGGISTVASISLMSTAITTFSTAISNTISSERSIEEKLENARNKSITVQGCDDLDLLNYYNGNKVHIIQYQVSSKLRSLMNSTFYYCGYASDRYGLPKARNRVWFDFLQCEPVFDEERTSAYQEFVKDIKSRYSSGVTRFHKVNNTWNFEQTKENWEYSLVRNLL